MILKENCVKIGVIGKPHGVKGEVSFLLDDGFFADELEFDFLLLDIENSLVPFEAMEIREKSDKNLLVKFDDVDTEAVAKKLTGFDVYLEKENIDTDSETVQQGLIGFQVEDSVKGSIGNLVAIQDIENNPLFVIEQKGNELLIPIHDDFIQDIDESNRVLKVNLPDGLVDLYIQNEEEE